MMMTTTMMMIIMVTMAAWVVHLLLQHLELQVILAEVVAPGAAAV